MKNESYQLKKQHILLSSNANFINIDPYETIKHQNFELIQKYYESQDYGPNYDFFIVLSHDENLIDIVIFKPYLIQFILRINNYIQDDILTVLNHDNVHITTNQSNCFDMYNVAEQKFLLFCSQNQSLLFQIINYHGTVHDEVMVESHNHPLAAFYSFRQLIIYEKYTNISEVLIINFNQNDTFNNFHQLFILNGSMFNKDAGKLIEILRFNSLTLSFIFQQIIVECQIANLQRCQGTQAYQDNIELVHYLHKFGENIIVGYTSDLTQDKLYEINSKEVKLNNNLKKPKQVFFNNENIIIEYKSFLICYNNNLVSTKINFTFRKLLELEKLPFLIGQQENKIILLKVFCLPKYFSLTKFHYLLGISISQFFASSDYQAQFEIIENIDKIDFGKRAIKQLTMHNDVQLVEFVFYEHMTGLPFYISEINDPSMTVQDVENLTFDNSFDKIDVSKFFFLLKNIDHKITIGYNLKNEIIIVDKQRVIRAGINLPMNCNNTFTSRRHPMFIIVIDLKIYCYSYLSSLQIEFEQDIQSPYFSIKQEEEWVSLFLTDCRRLIIFFDGFSHVYQNFIELPDCTQYLDFRRSDIFINKSSLYFKPKLSFSVLIEFHKIIDCEVKVKETTLLLFVISNKNTTEILINLYYVDSYELLFLYSLPRYTYQITYPLQYVTSSVYIAILATQGNSSQKVILVYRLTNQACNSLIKIIHIITELPIFNFADQDQYLYYVSENQIYLSNLKSITLKMNSKHSLLTNYVKQQNVSLQLKSHICCHEYKYQLSLDILNVDQSIFAVDPVLLYTTYSLNYQTSVNLSQVLGRVDDIKILSSDSTNQIKKPYTIESSIAISCTSFKSAVCIDEQSNVVFDIFDKLNQDAEYQMSKILFVTGNTVHKFYYFLSQNHDLIRIEQFHSRDEELFRYSSTILQSFSIVKKVRKVIGDILITEKISFNNNTDLQLLLLTNNKTASPIFIEYYQQQELVDLIYLENKDYLLIIIKNNYKLGFIRMTNFDISGQLQFILLPNITTKMQVPLIDMRILSSTQKDSILIFELIIAQKTNQCYILQGEYNLSSNLMNNIINTNVIRYSYQSTFKEFIFFNNQYLLINCFQKDFVVVTFLYDLARRDSKIIIDSIYADYSSEILSVDKYNDTHFAFHSQNQVWLSNIDHYKIQSNSCQSQPITLLLLNEISNFTIQYFISCETQFNKKFNIKLIILISGNTIVILFLLFNRKRDNFIHTRPNKE